MVTRGEINYLSSIVKIIREEERISTISLVIKSRKSLSYFEKMRRFIPELYKDIEYDKNEKVWKALAIEEIEEGDLN